MSDPRQQLFSDFHSAHTKAEGTPVHKRSFFVVHGIDMSFLKFCMVLDVFFCGYCQLSLAGTLSAE